MSKNGDLPARAGCKLSAEVVNRSFWREGTPKGVAGKEGWHLWSQHLADRSHPVSLDEICQAKGTALAWGINLVALPGETFELVQLLARSNREKLPRRLAIAEALSQWIAREDLAVPSVDFAVSCLAVANLLPRVAEYTDSELWWALVDGLAEVVEQTGDWRVDCDAAPEAALAHQLLVGELPLTLAYLFPEIRPLYKLRTAAHEMLAEGLMEFLNGAGLPKANLVPVSRALLACWTRCRAMGSQWKQGFWTNRAEEQYGFAVGKSVCLSSCTGQPLLCDSEAPGWTSDFLAAVMKFGGSAVDRRGALELFDKKLTKSIDGKDSKRLPEFSESCEWSGLAILRAGLGRDDAVVAIDFSLPTMRLDMWLGSQRLFNGFWTVESSSGGHLLEATGTWEETCWFSDSDVDYVEFSIELDQGARLERQVLLGRKDVFLLIVDNLMNAPGSLAQHRITLPLAAGIGFVPEAETREGLLIGDRALARALPIALPEWRTDPRVGDLMAAEGRLKLTEERPGKNLSCPLFLDLKHKRLTKPCTWRQLTVAESLVIQPHDVAVGYRIQCGKSQWLVYRSQAQAANRTVLGYNLSIEGMFGRFVAPGGEVQELLQIEG